MAASAPNVLRRSGLLSKNLYRQLTANAVRKVQLEQGLTDEELADKIGASDGTIANARNQNNSLSGELLLNLLDVCPNALEGHLHHFIRRSVPIEAKCDTDAIIPTSAAVHKLAIATSDGDGLTDRECLALEPDLQAAHDALAGLLTRCNAIRAERLRA